MTDPLPTTGVLGPTPSSAQTSTTASRRVVIGNVLSLTVGSGISQALMAVAFLLVARQLGAASFGEFAASFSAAALTSIVFNLGLDTWLLRAGVYDRENLSGLLRNAFEIKLLAGLPWLLALVLILPRLNPETFHPPLVLVSGLVIWLEGLFGVGLSVFRTLLRNQMTALLLVASRGGILLLTGILVVAQVQDVMPYALARLAAGIVIIMVTMWVLPIKPKRNAAIPLAGTARESLPFALSDLFASVYVQADVTIAGVALGKVAVGLYAPASSLISALLGFPTSLYYVAVPVLTARLGEDRNRFRRAVVSTLALFSLVGLVMWAIAWLCAGILPMLLGTSFTGSRALLVILSPILLLKGISFGAAAVLVAVGWQTRRMYVQGLAAILNVVLNLALIARFGITGVAAVYVVSETFLTIGYLAWVITYLRQSDRSLAPGG